MKNLTRLIVIVLLGLAVSLTVKNYTLQSELKESKENEVRTEWIKAQVEFNHENKNLIVVENGNK